VKCDHTQEASYVASLIAEQADFNSWATFLTGLTAQPEGGLERLRATLSNFYMAQIVFSACQRSVAPTAGAGNFG
jgi:hypothetical protein